MDILGIVEGLLARGWGGVRCNIPNRGGNYWNGQRAVEAREEAGFGGEIHLPAFARDDVNGAGSETDAHSAGNVAEEGAHQAATATANEQSIGVTFIVVLLLDNFPFGNFHVVARLAVRIDSRPANGDNAHLDGDKAAVDLNAFESQIHVGLAAEEREIFGLLDGPDNAVDAGAGGENDAAVESDGLGEDGDEGIAFAAGGTADGSEKCKVDLGALDNLARFGGCGRR